MAQRRFMLAAVNEAAPDTYHEFHRLFDPKNIEFISKEVSYRLKIALKENIRVPVSDIENALYEFYTYAYTNVEVMTQEAINALVNRIITDRELQDTSHWNKWVTQFDGTFGIQEVSFIKLNQKRMNTLEFSVQR